MNTRGIAVLSVAALSLVAVQSAFAQAGTGFTISQGDVFFTQANSPTLGTATSVSGGNFRVNGAAGTDHLFENWWWFRVDGVDTREFAFNNATGTSAAGNSATTNWTFANFSASLNYLVTDTGVNTGQVLQTMTVTNTTAQSIVLNLFNYTDYDVNATAGLDSAVSLGAGQIKVTDSANPAWDLRFNASAPNAFQVTSFATLRGLLTNTAINNLDSTGLPFGPGDFTGGYQWTLQMAPGQQMTVTETLAAVPEPGTMAVLGLGALALLRRRRKA